MPRRQTLVFTDSEILLLLRSYMERPAQWNGIVELMKGNLNQLPASCRQFYTDKDNKTIINRLRRKYGRLIRADLNSFTNQQIR